MSNGNDDAQRRRRNMGITDKSRTALGDTGKAAGLAGDNLNNTLKGIMSGMKIAFDEAADNLQKASERGGLFNRTLLEATPNFNATDAEGAKFADGGIKGFHNTFIIMGRDRPEPRSVLTRQPAVLPQTTLGTALKNRVWLFSACQTLRP